MKKIIAILLAAVMLLSFAACSAKKNETAPTQTVSDLAAIKEKGTLIVGITDYAPMDFKAEDGSWTGFDAEFAEAVAAKLGVKVEFVEIDWDNKFLELKTNAIDCIWNGMTITDDRKATMGISVPYMENKQVMVVKKDNAEKYSTAEGVKGALVIAEKESAGQEVAESDEFFKEAKFIGADSQAKALMEVKAGTSDIAIIDYIMSKGTIKEESDYSDLTVIEAKSFAPEEYGVAFRKGADTTQKVNEAMQKVADSGKLKEIADKYNLGDMLMLKAK